MLYRSTRGGVSDRRFDQVLLEGLAPDGGLYVPEELPELPPADGPYARVVADFVAPFVAPDDLADRLEDITENVYSAFRHPEVAPLRDLGNGKYLLELFWGPTLSFKDYALQLVGALFEQVLARKEDRLLILGATSGDTGSAAIEACRGRPNLDIVILFPDGAVSEVQRRQMTTVPDANVHSVAVEGTFDDCQHLVKAAFTTFRERYLLGAINSINWARIVAQAAYYSYVSALFDEPVDVVVPTGNFGNVLSAHVARRMGAPIAGLIVANNANHGLADLIQTGRLNVGGVAATVAPAMDIQIPSNLERYLFEALDEDAARLREVQTTLSTSGTIDLPPEVAARLRSDFSADWRDDGQIREAIQKAHDATGTILDPHTAVAWSVASARGSGRPTVVVGTAHPAKFGEVVEAALGSSPELPADVAADLERPERMERIPADLTSLESLLASVAT